MPWTTPVEGGLLWGGDWEYESLRATLQLMTDTFAALSGFELASLNIVEGDELVSTVNSDIGAPGSIRGEAVAANELTGMRFPMSEVMAMLDSGDDWGRFLFIPKERMGGDDYDGSAWVSGRSYGDEADAWHPMHTLLAPMRNGAGQLVGVLSVDQPTSGKIPDATTREVLNTLAAQLENSLLNALASAQLQERATLAAAVHDLVQTAAAQPTVAAAIDVVAEPLMKTFDLAGAWIRLFDGGGLPAGMRRVGGAVDLPEDPLLTLATHVAAPQLLERGAAAVVGPRQAVNAENEILSIEHLRDFLQAHGLGSMLFVPLGAGPRCIGSLTLVRGDGAPQWSEAEYHAGIELGLDLGAVVAATSSLAQEQEVVKELTELDAYKDYLISKVSDELRTPLQSIVVDLERLGGAGGRDTDTIASMQANATQMNVMVDHLLQLARVADPNVPVERRPVDLVPLVEYACDWASSLATSGQEITASVPSEPVVVAGSPSELRRMVENLLHNAVRFMPYPGSIRVSLLRAGHDAVISVSDDGIGIPAVELGHVFEEFYRSSHPAAQELQGTGLGLAIVSRVVFRHGGHIEVTSALSQGSTFATYLPLASD